MNPQLPPRQNYKSPPLVSPKIRNNNGGLSYYPPIVPPGNPSPMNSSYHNTTSPINTSPYTSPYRGPSAPVYSSPYSSPHNGPISPTYSNSSNQFSSLTNGPSQFSSPTYGPSQFTSPHNGPVQYNLQNSVTAPFISPRHGPQTYGSPNSLSVNHEPKYDDLNNFSLNSKSQTPFRGTDGQFQVNQGNRNYQQPPPQR
ncbi:hypothetical protein H8356DRAFT_1307613 [Neocallimastix lanati (nom. inval.)]|uniref:Uncharacterized protein n=1 Tax=Neocallimastix californiae TaxID=1754190 RepID=A0A1Y2EWE0_9FUNG|nr:hypothetical protein H8356DRAFT_1307613 [Neocallimastix sp. JGI-2020a]ORY75574.1 hypothetical protein LY90DRAFT_502119 [Neocallimastix californiae]|eukprot:ORY75574.1 hypothetical protein LY90DRAFT_502119 [Neocallimastix californiae]